jgi:transcriptional regulator with XRE-family HTH domain
VKEKTLQELREAKKLKQREVACFAKVSVSAVGMWETGKRKPYKKADILAKLYGVSVSDIFLAIKITESDKSLKETG